MSTNVCKELVDTRDGFVACNAKWRTNHPFGKKQKGKTIMIRQHHDKCVFKTFKTFKKRKR